MGLPDSKRRSWLSDEGILVSITCFGIALSNTWFKNSTFLVVVGVVILFMFLFVSLMLLLTGVQRSYEENGSSVEVVRDNATKQDPLSRSTFEYLGF